MGRSEHILIVDDDAEIRNLLRDYLTRNGMRAEAVGDGRAMRTALRNGRYDLVILDLMLPGEDGLTLCRDLRAHSNLPVIMLTARGEDTDRIVGLEMGADDYVPKPFNPRELLARIKAVLRRAQSLPSSAPMANAKRLRFAGWTLDLTTHQLSSPKGVVTPLSSGEYRLLCVFLEHPNRVLSRDQLLELAHNRGWEPFDRSIDIRIARIRRKVERDPGKPQVIKTVRGAGYIYSPRSEAG